MFGDKNNRYFVKLTVEFNVTAIADWLKRGAKPEELDVIGDNSEKAWEDAEVRSYEIDVLPVSPSRDLFFHRKQGKFSWSLAGADWVVDDEDLPSKLAEEIGYFRWEWWHDYLHLFTEKGAGLLAPVHELAQLRQNGEIKVNNLRGEEGKISVPRLLDENGKILQTTEILRKTWGKEVVRYSTQFAAIQAQTQGFEESVVEY